MMVSEERSFAARPPIVRPEIVRRMAADGMSMLDIAKRLRLGYDAIAMLLPEVPTPVAGQPRTEIA